MGKNAPPQNLRIHGDNILECESALKLLSIALNPTGKGASFFDGPAYAPIYRINTDDEVVFDIQLFSGYGRWGFDIKKYLQERGAPLREATDAIITRLSNAGQKQCEQFILALEFCGALPAGNNAWQRCGRALALVYSKIPYMHFAEIGGLELDADRREKAPRFPNPLIPFAYLTLGDVEHSIAIPVFVPSPSSSKTIRKKFDSFYGLEDAVELIRNIVLNKSTADTINTLRAKAEGIVQVLARDRKRRDCLSPDEWKALAEQKSGYTKAIWLIGKAMPWNKKTGIKTLTHTFKKLLKGTIKNGAIAVGSKDMPMCLISQNKRKKYAQQLKSLYKNRVTKEFLNWISDDTKPLLCVWIAGFKPRGDDSRPDRGLVPLCRMIFGKSEVDLLGIVYGPAKVATWKRLQKNMWELARINGLWEAIIGLSDGILVDSPTSKRLKNIGYLMSRKTTTKGTPIIEAARAVPYFGEHDVDSTLHLLFSNKAKEGLYEGLCNPPGGDWSGISIIDFKTDKEYRWTSLPRVSGKNTKRPDHLVQLKFNKYLLSIESKDTSSTLKNNIGTHLKAYVNRLIQKAPIAYRNYGNNQWQPIDHKIDRNFKILSGGAFKMTGSENLKEISRRGKLDIVLGMDFSSEKKLVIINASFADSAKDLIPILYRLISKYPRILEMRLVSANS